MTVILASGSPRRRTLLSLLVDDFDVVVPDVEETLPEGQALDALEQVALRKADAVPRGPDDVVVAADTSILHAGHVLGKPTDADHAHRMLESLQRITHQVVTAVAVAGPRGTTTFHVTSHVRMDLPDPVLSAYLESGDWKGKAGAYGLQDAAIAPHIAVDGPWSNVVGLPLQAVQDALIAQGAAVHTPPSESGLRLRNPF